MKERLKEIYNDYLNEFKEYFYKFKGTIIKKWQNPQNKYSKIAIDLCNKLYLKINIYYQKFKTYLLASENRKRNLTGVGILLITNILSLFVLLLLPSLAIYKDTYSYSLIGAKVGDKYINEFDYVLLVYAENANSTGEGSGNYTKTEEIPLYGFTYSGYKCQNGATLVYDDEEKNTSVTIDKKDICSIYFDLISASDIVININLEDGVGTNNYQIANQIPYYGYRYSHYECEKNSTLTYDSDLHKVKVSTNQKEVCNIYFQKESVDIEITLFVEETYQSGNYIERLSIPENILYTLNESKSSCVNSNNESAYASITYSDGYILVNSSEIVSCKAYLDRAE